MVALDRNRKARDSLSAWRADKAQNYLETDANIQRVFRMHMAGDYGRHEPLLRTAAGRSAGAMNLLAVDSNRDENLPRLSRFDAFGVRTEEVIFHPDYHELGSYVWDTGVLTVLEQPGQQLLSGALAYFFTHNGEGGHACPVACTAGLIGLLQQVGSSAQKRKYLPRLLERDYSRRLHAAQFVTEVQGGSDVATADCVAVADSKQNGLYRIHGEKWFCSVADAGLFVLAARPEGAPAGTRGLGLFLVPRSVDGKINEFSIRRLKYKLGTRSMASAEIDFDGALAEPIGPLDQGFKNLVSIVLDTSRVYNAVASCGMIRRACIEAWSYARHRTAFSRPIIEHPMLAEIVVRIHVVSAAAVATTFRILAMGDKVAKAEATADLVAARRVNVNINKYWTSIQCTRVVRDAIEVLGGNGTIEEFSVLPRLYRDAIVLESWEGTHNTLCAQVLRDFASRGLHRPWLAELGVLISSVTQPTLAAHRSRALTLLEDLCARIEQLISVGGDVADLRIRAVVDQMCTLNNYVSLMLELEWDLDQGMSTQKACLVEMYCRLFVERKEPMDDAGMVELIARTRAALSR